MFVRSQLTIYLWVYFWNICSVPLIYMQIFTQYHVLLITVARQNSGSVQSQPSDIVLLFKKMFAFLNNFRVSFSVSMKKPDSL